MILFKLIIFLLLITLSLTLTSLSTMTYNIKITLTNMINNIITISNNNYIKLISNNNNNDNNNNYESIINESNSDSIVYYDWNSNNNNINDDDDEKRDALKRLLFPNITVGDYHFGGYHDINDNNDNFNGETNDIHSRRLAPIVKPPYDKDKTVCLTCSGMKTCPILDQLMIMEVYLPNNPSEKGTCNVIDALGERVYGEIFGNGKTFRDTTQCKDIVMQYLCLFWGSDNQMYTNYCIYKEDYTSVNPELHYKAPRPPCRSFCVQLADVCANDPGFINICNQIACPPTEDKCVPDPKINGQSLAANIGCDMPYFLDPYAPKNSACSTYNNINYYLLIIMISIFILIWSN